MDQLKKTLATSGLLHALAVILKSFTRAAIEAGEEVPNHSTTTAQQHILSGPKACVSVIDLAINKLEQLREKVTSIDDESDSEKSGDESGSDVADDESGGSEVVDAERTGGEEGADDDDVTSIDDESDSEKSGDESGLFSPPGG